ncbi:Uncharacterised protein [Mycobacteroides abscessus subsp. abscessus]|nr:Uncharacterised protein [Mycobacteroides abscessus]SHP27850.1 Uncharacterised protein [Mycobacteroides abscessus subsp. abscessus]CPU23900.1 Uncharacterised protein [Mycobacteroides abscessus]SHP55434.1 Uncharacterised protein [Mycobacteroides abscessus subsp. abscessus]SHP94191.1 Uncharacterised protein [Mycobacteroides abscessus subsp. abscessus]
MLVLINPGQMALTPTPLGPSSSLKHSVSIFTPAFDTEYGAITAVGVNAAAEAILTICPLPRSTICSPNTRHPCTTPMRFTESKRSQSAGVSFRNGPPSAIPALFTSTSGTPYSMET